MTEIKHRLIPILFACILLLNCSKSNSNQADDTSISPSNYISKLGKGIDATWVETNTGINSYNVKSVIDFKNKGFSHARLRIHLNLNTNYNHLDKVINDCIDNGLIPILACQADSFEVNPTETNLNDFLLFWQTLAERYKNYSHLLSFNLIVEVSGGLSSQPDKLNEAYEKAVSIIRTTNPKRNIFIAPRKLSDPTYLTELVIPTKGNGYILAEWHFYAAGPSKTNPNKLWTTGTAAEKKLITDKIQLAKNWETQTGIKTWVGAWMPGDYNNGDNYTVAEQLVFGGFMSCELSKAYIPFAINADHKFYDATTNQWISSLQPVVIEILNPSNCP